MSSSIFFKFRNQKDLTPIAFDGSSLSVFEVKREIMKIARLGDGKDFDLDISTSDTGELYDDDTTQIPRSTTVVARRMPAAKNGAGRAARYVTGSMPLHAKNSHRTESNLRGGVGKNASAANGVKDMSSMTEEEKLAAVMNASNTQFQADLQSSANIPTKRNAFKPAAVPDKPLPPGYVCYRCRKKGHWIQACPTNNDPTFDGKKPKRTTGIPRSMLEKVEEPDTDKELPQGVFMNQDGDYVRVKTDDATWQKIQEQQKAAAEKAKEAAAVDQELIDRGLVCALDNRPFTVPVKTPCCGTTYCNDCIENALIDNDLICPNCGEQALLDDLKPNEDALNKLTEYEAEQKAGKLQKEKEASRSPKPVAATAPGSPETKSPASTASPSKKRKADDELDNKRTPATSAPATTTQTQPPNAPKSMTDFVNQMNAISSTMGGGQNGMNAYVNPMMNPMNMNMPMNGMGFGMGMPPPMMGPMMGMPMGPFNPMGMNGMPMGNYNGMNNMNGMGNFNAMNGGMNGMGNFNGMNDNNAQQPWINAPNRNGVPTGPAADNGGAYFRQPVNPHRHQHKGRRQRSVDYREM
ncbi:hypothetical protein CERZMDRAFT_39057 [Cercospora zeae-maydis SCOH1-5]|uniref:DWNN domain-containing protein n=1 Tax=Cercospora zeae-maydis SCOH1-5 TaxID=717836 RepID=A0A6A6FJT7_9PEZI|nr:hypothetical protein CERZMDRAFT_39057 [Cercospora zeae-maydis SCOH1-5]